MPHSKHQITPITSTFFSKDPTHLPSGYKSFNKENVTFAFSLPKISGHHCDKQGKNMGASSSFGCYTLIHLPIKCLRKVVEDGPCVWVPTIHMGALEEAPGYQFQPGPLLE